MNTRALVIAPVAAVLLGVGGWALASTSTSNGAASMQSGPGMMQSTDATGMAQMKSGDTAGPDMMSSGMMGGNAMGNGMMGSGMMGMMNSCPMMGAASGPMMGAANGPNSKVMMQMHGEMMRAMGDIMIKYADKLDMPSSSK
jgi:hypothetical protein